ncbi:hypothetical protein QBC39DRAFT_354665, partial [Podospora conica]
MDARSEILFFYLGEDLGLVTSAVFFAWLLFLHQKDGSDLLQLLFFPFSHLLAATRGAGWLVVVIGGGSKRASTYSEVVHL